MKTLAQKAKWNAYMNAYNKRNPDKVKEHDRKAYKKFKQRYIDNAAKWRKNNPEQYKQHVKKFFKRHPEKHREYTIKSRYNMTPEQFDSLLVKQDHRCAICRVKPDYILSIDHNHKTDKVRGLLCQRCNLAIGFIEIEGLLPKIQDYLE